MLRLESNNEGSSKDENENSDAKAGTGLKDHDMKSVSYKD